LATVCCLRRDHYPAKLFREPPCCFRTSSSCFRQNRTAAISVPMQIHLPAVWETFSHGFPSLASLSRKTYSLFHAIHKKVTRAKRGLRSNRQNSSRNVCRRKQAALPASLCGLRGCKHGCPRSVTHYGRAELRCGFRQSVGRSCRQIPHHPLSPRSTTARQTTESCQRDWHTSVPDTGTAVDGSALPKSGGSPGLLWTFSPVQQINAPGDRIFADRRPSWCRG